MIALFVSCSAYRSLQIEVLQPASIEVERGKRVAFMDRNIRQEDSPLLFVDPESEKSLFREFARGINHVFTEMEYDTLILLAERDRTLLPENVYPYTIPTDTVNSLCRKFNMEYIISLEMQYYEVRRHIVTCKWLVRLYKSGCHAPLDSIILSGFLPDMEYEDMDLLFQDIQIACWDKGASYAKRITPYWEQTERRVYGQGKVLGLGDVFLQEGKTEEAIRIWKGACELSGKRAIQAGINLAWVYEDSGDFARALGFLEWAEKLAGENRINNQTTVYLQEYLQIIRQRIEQQKILDQQINSNRE